MSRRTLVAVVGWVAAAGLAVGAGLAAVTFIGSDLTSSVDQPRQAGDVARDLSTEPLPPSAVPPTGPSSAGPSPGGPSASAVPPGSAVEVIRTLGGSVNARCVGELVQLSAFASAQGYEVHDRPGSEPVPQAEVSFRGADREFAIEASCAGGTVQSRVREKRR